MNQPTILWVDDDRIRTQRLAEWLIADGFVVHFAHTAGAAMTKLKELAATLTAVVVDVVIPCEDADPEVRSMGELRSGILLAGWIRRNFPQLEIVGYSLEDSDEVREWFEHNGCAFLSKKTS